MKKLSFAHTLEVKQYNLEERTDGGEFPKLLYP